MSGQGLRILDFCCAVAADRPEQPLDFWPLVEQVCGGAGRRGRNEVKQGQGGEGGCEGEWGEEMSRYSRSSSGPLWSRCVWRG